MRILEKPITKVNLIKESENFIDDSAIKGAVDIKNEIMAVDSQMHYECEQLLLENGSKQENIGALIKWVL